MILNGAHTVSEELDIFGKVGRGVAHDEVIPFTVKNGRIVYNGESSPIEGNKVSIRFVKVRCLLISSKLMCKVIVIRYFCNFSC